ncbi:hypothetical protein P0I90_004688 [Vibrio parahaemolyticus]|nr:hypothetical protein [Vibrio parahaemolyticus]EKO5210635.1 hypothetical protein [Vibrio parahaemolyticus]MBE4250057.1 hypothetical protein [Vibrio parahaemolyticus]MDF5637197.1 hypothetical protein [Vibrio parahaemolyticus]
MDRLLIVISILVLTACSAMREKADYVSPSENYINIEGNIVDSLTYKIKVQYVARSESKECKDYSWLVGRHLSQSIEFEYRPTIKNSRHYLHIPLKELDPNTECNWEPNVIFLCVASAGNDPSSCSSLFFLRGKHDNNLPVNIECAESNFCFRKPFDLHTEDINILNKVYSVNIAESKT